MSAKGALCAAVAAVGLVTALAGCSGGSDQADDGGSFSVAEGNSPLDTLLPANTQLAYSELDVLWAPIVSFDSDGEVKYIQAKSITASDHERVWTIKFRPGWKFHNDELVTAQSYADGWNLTAYGPNAYSNSGQLSNIVGYDAMNPKKGTPKAKKLSGVEVVDTYTLRVKLVKPDSQFPLELSQGQTGFYPMPKAGLKDPKAFRTNPIGNGPYRMDGEAKLNQYVKMRRYDAYRGPNKGQIERLTFKLYNSPETAYTDAMAGNVDISLAPQSKFTQVKKDFGDRITYARAPAVEYLGFPLFDKRFKNIKLRQAISLAIDRKAINKAVFGNIYQPADSMIAPATVGGTTHSCKHCTFDPQGAKKLLAEAGGWQGSMTIAYPGGAGYDQAFKAVANQIRQNLGIDAKAQPSVDFSDFFSHLAEKKYRDGPYRGKWGSAYPSAADTLKQLFTPTGPYNNSTGFYSNPKVTAQIAKGDAAGSLDKATKYYQEAERTIMADFPVVPMFYESFPFSYSTRVSNVHSRPMQISVDLESVKLK